MTIEARFNLQRGIPENKLYSGTNYTNESLLDSYLIQTQAILNRGKEETALEDYLKSKIEESLEEVLEDLLKDFS